MNTVNILREKLQWYGKPVISRELLDKILKAVAPKYTIALMCRRGIITPLKKGKLYFNNMSNTTVHSWEVGALYCGEGKYAFGGIALANRYGMSTQVPDRLTIYSTTYRGKKIIGKHHKFIFKLVRPAFFYGLEQEIRNEISINRMTPERLLIQMVREGASLEFVQELPRVVDKEKLYAMAEKYASKSVLSTLKTLYEKNLSSTSKRYYS